jgi:uncharacterized protein HemY
MALVLTLVAGLVGTTRMAAVANEERTRSEAVRAFLFSLWQGADPEVNRGTIPTALDLLERGVGLIDSVSADAGADVRTDLLSTLGFLYVKLGRYDQAAEIFRRAVVEADSAFGADERTGGALDGLAQSLELAGRRKLRSSAPASPALRQRGAFNAITR